MNITNDTKCKLIKTGGSIIKDVGEFKKHSSDYYEDHMKSCLFPPTYYLKNSSTSQWADKMANAFNNSSDAKIIVGYNPIIHMQLLGFEKTEYMELLSSPTTAKYDNSVIVVHNKKRIAMVCLVSDETNDALISTELKKLDTILKGIYFGNLSEIKNSFVSIVGLLVCRNIDFIFDLNNCQHINFNDIENLKKLIITKTQWSSAETLINNFASEINQDIKNICPGNSNQTKVSLSASIFHFYEY